MSLERLDLIGPVAQFSYGNSDTCSAEERPGEANQDPLTKCQAQCLDPFKRRRVTPAAWPRSSQISVREAERQQVGDALKPEKGKGRAQASGRAEQQRGRAAPAAQRLPQPGPGPRLPPAEPPGRGPGTAPLRP